MSEASTNPEQTRFPCPGCSAGMEFDPASKALKCDYCGTAVAVRRDASAEGVPEMPYDRYAHAQENDLSKIAGDALQFSCSSCGATVQFQPPQVSGTCPFCAAQVVAQTKSADPLIAPQGVLPFQLPKQQAAASVGTWLQSRWFAPNALKRVAKPEGLTGMYLPFWSFDARTESDYRGQRGEYYFVNEEVWVSVNGRQERRIQQVRKVRWYPASGSVEVVFDDLLEPATKAVDAKRLAKLEPWDLPKLEPYEPGYLAGFQAQRYQLELEPAFEQAKEMMKPEILVAVRRAIGGDEQQVHHVSTSYFDVTFRHLLLPAWIGAYRFQNKVYQIMVNARTGEVQGERPYSVIKIVLFVLALFLGLVVVSQVR